MTKQEIQEWINCINTELLGNSDKQLEVLKTSTDYTYNKAIALTDKSNSNKGWH